MHVQNRILWQESDKEMGTSGTLNWCYYQGRTPMGVKLVFAPKDSGLHKARLVVLATSRRNSLSGIYCGQVESLRMAVASETRLVVSQMDATLRS